MTRRVASAGYSGTPLHRKLGLAPGHRVYAAGAPGNLAALLAGAPPDLAWLPRLAAFDVALMFATEIRALERDLNRVVGKLPDTGAIWVAWPKKTSGVATELSEDVIRDIGLAHGVVDVKVCAIDATWSGLKFVRRRARPGSLGEILIRRALRANRRAGVRRRNRAGPSLRRFPAIRSRAGRAAT